MAVFGVFGLALACTNDPNQIAPNSSWAGGTATTTNAATTTGGVGGATGVDGSAATSTTGAATGGTTMVPTDCTLEESNITEAKRLVRLTWPQQASAAAQLLGQQFADQIIADFAIQRPDERTFPPLLNPREGRSITAAVWQQNDNIAQSGGSYVFDN